MGIFSPVTPSYIYRNRGMFSTSFSFNKSSKKDARGGPSNGAVLVSSYTSMRYPVLISERQINESLGDTHEDTYRESLAGDADSNPEIPDML